MNGNLERLLTTKQEELRAITVWKVVELEKKYIAKEKECREKDVKIKGLMTTFDSMRSDFAYNLELLRERDLELERYDKFVKQYRESLNSKDFEIVKYQQDIEELRSKVTDLEEKVSTSEAKVMKLTLELSKLREEKKKDSELAQKEIESVKLQFEADLDFSRRAAQAAEQAGKREAMKHAKENEVSRRKLEKSESARNQAEMDLRSLQMENERKIQAIQRESDGKIQALRRESEGEIQASRRESEIKIQAMKARTQKLEASMEKLTALKERLESENIEKSHTLVEQRKRVEDVQEEIMSAYKGKVQKLLDELTLVKEQHVEQCAALQEQLTQSGKKLADTEKKLIEQEAAHKIELVTASEELDRLEQLKVELEEELEETKCDFQKRVNDARDKVDEADRKADETEMLLEETNAKLVEKHDALIALNTELLDVKREKDELAIEKDELTTKLSNQSAQFDLDMEKDELAIEKDELTTKLSNQSAQFDLDMEKANEELRKSSKETEMIRAMDERHQEMAEASFWDEKRKLTDLAKRLRDERDEHFQDLQTCRKELRSIQDELEKKNNRAMALEEQGSSVRHVITDMRLEMEKMRKKFKRELDRKVEELSRYKQKDYDMKRKLATLQVEKEEIEINGTYDSNDIQRELRETKQKLSQLSSEREHLMDINNCLKADLNKAIHTFTPIRGAEYTPRSHNTYNDSPWARGPLILQKEPTPPTLKRTRLKERLDEIKSELADQSRQ